MIIKLDKPFLHELQDCGFSLDYKMLVRIYQKSRTRPEAILQCRKRKSGMDARPARRDAG